MQSIVMKFGGTSVGDAQRIAQVVKIIKDFRRGAFRDWLKEYRDPVRAVVVVSAMEGVTDALVEAARSAARRDGQTFQHTAQELRRCHREAAEALQTSGEGGANLRAEIEALVSGFQNLCQAIYILGELTPRGLDAVASLGEQLSARIVTAALNEQSLPARLVEATQLIVTDDHYGAASPLMEATRERVRAVLLPLLAEEITPVVTGFIAATADGVTTTLGRGGSDYSAAILGSCLDSQEVWIWTDVNGVLTADPRVVPEAQTLPAISYAEAAELSYFGAKVLYPKTVLPAMEQGIPLRILNTFEPQHPGTMILSDVQADRYVVKGITAIKGLSLLTVEGRGMIGVPGMAAKLFSAVANQGISVLMISQSSSEQNICFVIRQEDTGQALAALETAFELELAQRNVDRIWAQNEVAIVAAVGAGMKGTPGVAAKIFGALGQRGINVISIAQGSSEYNLSLVVAEQDADQAVRAIHQEFGLGRETV
ncbi:MAG: aspartate kinase [Anaerolineae bacterium]